MATNEEENESGRLKKELASHLDASIAIASALIARNDELCELNGDLIDQRKDAERDCDEMRKALRAREQQQKDAAEENARVSAERNEIAACLRSRSAQVVNRDARIAELESDLRGVRAEVDSLRPAQLQYQQLFARMYGMIPIWFVRDGETMPRTLRRILKRLAKAERKAGMRSR